MKLGKKHIKYILLASMIIAVPLLIPAVATTSCYLVELPFTYSSSGLLFAEEPTVTFSSDTYYSLLFSQGKQFTPIPELPATISVEVTFSLSDIYGRAIGAKKFYFGATFDGSAKDRTASVKIPSTASVSQVTVSIEAKVTVYYGSALAFEKTYQKQWTVPISAE